MTLSFLTLFRTPLMMAHSPSPPPFLRMPAVVPPILGFIQVLQARCLSPPRLRAPPRWNSEFLFSILADYP